jgi:hypothetical protein
MRGLAELGAMRMHHVSTYIVGYPAVTGLPPTVLFAGRTSMSPLAFRSV